jgi:hypothetical protein
VAVRASLSPGARLAADQIFGGQMKRRACLLLGVVIGLASTSVASAEAKASSGELTQFGAAAGSADGFCSFNGTIDGFIFSTTGGHFDLKGSTFKCRDTLNAPPPSRLVATSAAFSPSCWNGTAFVGAVEWKVVLGSNGQATYTCSF